jgi:hypothetical protein
MISRARIALLLALAAVAWSCSGERERDTSTTNALVLPATGPDSLKLILAARARGLLHALTSSGQDPSEYLNPRFTMANLADSTHVIRPGLDGKPADRLDYFKLFSARLSAHHGIIRSMEVVPVVPGHAAVIVFHDSVPPTITRWERAGANWEAVSMALNVSEETVNKVRGVSLRAR